MWVPGMARLHIHPDNHVLHHGYDDHGWIRRHVPNHDSGKGALWMLHALVREPLSWHSAQCECASLIRRRPVCAHVLLGRERSGVFALGLPIVVIGVSFNDAFAKSTSGKLSRLLKKRRDGAYRWLCAHSACILLAPNALSHACDVHRRAAGVQESDAPIRQESDAPIPDYDDVLALRYAASVLYQLYVSTGDDRFYQARDALIKDLPVELFEPPMPPSRTFSNCGAGSNPSAIQAPSQEEPAVPVSVSGTDTEPQADDATDPEPDGQEDET